MSQIKPWKKTLDNYELKSIDCIHAIDPRTGNLVAIRGPFFTMPQLGRILDMRERSIYVWCTRGTSNDCLRTVVVGDQYLTSASMVYEFLKNSSGRTHKKLAIFEEYMQKYQENNMAENARMSAIEAYTPEGYKPRKVVIRRKKNKEEPKGGCS